MYIFMRDGGIWGYLLFTIAVCMLIYRSSNEAPPLQDDMSCVRKNKSISDTVNGFKNESNTVVHEKNEELKKENDDLKKKNDELVEVNAKLTARVNELTAVNEERMAAKAERASNNEELQKNNKIKRPDRLDSSADLPTNLVMYADWLKTKRSVCNQISRQNTQNENIKRELEENISLFVRWIRLKYNDDDNSQLVYLYNYVNWEVNKDKQKDPKDEPKCLKDGRKEFKDIRKELKDVPKELYPSLRDLALEALNDNTNITDEVKSFLDKPLINAGMCECAYWKIRTCTSIPISGLDQSKNLLSGHVCKIGPEKIIQTLHGENTLFSKQLVEDDRVILRHYCAYGGKKIEYIEAIVVKVISDTECLMACPTNKRLEGSPVWMHPQNMVCRKRRTYSPIPISGFDPSQNPLSGHVCKIGPGKTIQILHGENTLFSKQLVGDDRVILRHQPKNSTSGDTKIVYNYIEVIVTNVISDTECLMACPKGKHLEGSPIWLHPQNNAPLSIISHITNPPKRFEIFRFLCRNPSESNDIVKQMVSGDNYLSSLHWFEAAAVMHHLREWVKGHNNIGGVKEEFEWIKKQADIMAKTLPPNIMNSDHGYEREINTAFSTTAPYSDVKGDLYDPKEPIPPVNDIVRVDASDCLGPHIENIRKINPQKQTLLIEWKKRMAYTTNTRKEGGRNKMPANMFQNVKLRKVRREPKKL